LAERSYVSRDLIAELEQDRRTSARITTLVRLANALGIGLSGLLGKRERLGPLLDGGVLAVRMRCCRCRTFPGSIPR
jgi:transcriptional regulator with XRE-family HTH domain